MKEEAKNVWVNSLDSVPKTGVVVLGYGKGRAIHVYVKDEDEFKRLDEIYESQLPELDLYIFDGVYGWRYRGGEEALVENWSYIVGGHGKHINVN